MKALILFSLLFAQFAEAKSFETFGAVPFLSLSKSLSAKTDLSFYHSDTFALTEGKFASKKYPSRDQQAYFQTSIGYKLTPSFNLAIGHIYQRNNPMDVDFVNEHRIFEQATFSHIHFDKQFTHRIRFEQRFIDERHNHQNKTRLRYQVGMSFPLQGRQLDPGEWYFNSYNEFYFSTTGERNAFYSDDWVYAGCGYLTQEWGKIEVGPLAQYSVVNRDKDIRAFYALQLGWILSFK